MAKKNVLFYSVLAIFIGTAAVTLLGLSQIITVKDDHLDWLLTTLIGQVVVAVISLFKGTTFFEEGKQKNHAPIDEANKANQVATPNIGDPPKKASQKDEKSFLSAYKQWNVIEIESNGVVNSRELHRTYEFKSFDAAFDFMSKAAHEVIALQDHHPRWENTYNRVEVWLTTLNLNRQLSNRDIKLATSLELLWVETGKGLSNV